MTDAATLPARMAEAIRPMPNPLPQCDRYAAYAAAGIWSRDYPEHEWRRADLDALNAVLADRVSLEDV
jgi:hypothetical protein